MEQFANLAATTLNGAILAGDLTLVVTSATGFPATGNFRLRVDTGANLEFMLVTGVSGTTFTVTRGIENTTGVGHANSVAITSVLTAGALTQLEQDVATGAFYTTVHQVAHGFTQGQAIYSTGSAWALAESNSSNTLGIALVSYVGVDNFYAVFGGTLTGLSALTAGQYYYISDATPGALTATEPTALTSYSNPILLAFTATTGLVIPFRPSAILSAASYTSTNDFLLDCEPDAASTNYTVTNNGISITNESWNRLDMTLLKSVDYTYNSSLQATVEVRKVFATNGSTIVAELTIAYTYTGSFLASATYTRNV